MRKNLVSYLLIIGLLLTVWADASVEKLIIVGSGPAGLSSAIYAGQAGLKPLVIEGEECSGQLETVHLMENYPGFPEGISGEQLVSRMWLQAEKFDARRISDAVVDMDLSKRPFRIQLKSGEIMQTETLILALGTSKRWLGLDSEEALKGFGVSGSAACEGYLFQGKEVVVLGGGEAALEEALALTEYASKVTIIHHSNKFNALTYTQEKIFSHEKIHIVWDSKVEEILDVKQGRVTGLVVKNTKTNEQRTLSCEGVFVSIGREPNMTLFKDQLEMTASGHIWVNYPTTETSVPGVFAAGDVSDTLYRKAITAAGFGSMAAMDVIRFLSTPP